MIRKIVHIDETLCTGCGACAEACHEGAIEMIDGKAVLIRDDYCDGLGDCLPACPAGAIEILEREAAPYNEEAVRENFAAESAYAMAQDLEELREAMRREAMEKRSALSNWPVQMKLAPVSSPSYDDAHLLIAADCTAYAYGAFHQDYLKGKTLLIGCPKLDMTDYSEKLTAILKENDIREITLLRMEVPCCGGLQMAVVQALRNCGKEIPAQMEIFSTEGKVIS